MTLELFVHINQKLSQSVIALVPAVSIMHLVFVLHHTNSHTPTQPHTHTHTHTLPHTHIRMYTHTHTHTHTHTPGTWCLLQAQWTPMQGLGSQVSQTPSLMPPSTGETGMKCASRLTLWG